MNETCTCAGSRGVRRMCPTHHPEGSHQALLTSENARLAAHIATLEATLSKYREALEKIRELVSGRTAFGGGQLAIGRIIDEVLADEKEKKS